MLLQSCVECPKDAMPEYKYNGEKIDPDSLTCNGHGQILPGYTSPCVYDTLATRTYCTCAPGWTGTSCNVPDKLNVWCGTHVWNTVRDEASAWTFAEQAVFDDAPHLYGAENIVRLVKNLPTKTADDEKLETGIRFRCERMSASKQFSEPEDHFYRCRTTGSLKDPFSDHRWPYDFDVQNVRVWADAASSAGGACRSLLKLALDMAPLRNMRSGTACPLPYSWTDLTTASVARSFCDPAKPSDTTCPDALSIVNTPHVCRQLTAKWDDRAFGCYPLTDRAVTLLSGGTRTSALLQGKRLYRCATPPDDPDLDIICDIELDKDSNTFGENENLGTTKIAQSPEKLAHLVLKTCAGLV